MKTVEKGLPDRMFGDSTGPIRSRRAFRSNRSRLFVHASKGVHNDWQFHAHSPRLALRGDNCGLLNPGRLRRGRKCETHRGPGADARTDNSNADPGASEHSDARAFQFHAEPNARHTGLGLLAQRTPTPSAIQFRWNAAIGKYEVLGPAHADWGRLEALQDLQFGGAPYKYDVFGSGGTKFPFDMIVWAPPLPWWSDGNVGNARIFKGSSGSAYFAFGIATSAGDVPVSGTMTCSFAEDEIGEGRLTFDLAAGTMSGWAEPFWARVRYQFVETSFARGATTFAATFGEGGVLEGRFFGPRAVNLAVRVKGGDQGLAGVNGIMTGRCAA
jgi:hypothetical protein